MSRGNDAVLEDLVYHSCLPAPSKSVAFLICGPDSLEKGVILPGIVLRFPMHYIASMPQMLEKKRRER